MTRHLALLSILAFSVCAWITPVCAAEPGTPGSQPVGGGRIKVLLVGGRGHDWRGFHEAIAPVLEKTGDFQLTLTEKLDDLRADNVSNYKVILFYGSGGDFSDPKQEEGLQDFVKNGGGLAGVHATDAFKKSDVYWRLLGGRFTTHGGGKFWLRIEDKQHPITAGMGDFEIQDETYQSEYHPEFKLHSLGRIDRGNEQQSMIWAQDYGQGRVFNTTLGHDGSTWKNPQFERLLVRGLYWAAGREPQQLVYVSQSWDDAPLNDARLVPLLKKYKAKATFFVDPRNLADVEQPADGGKKPRVGYPYWGWFGYGKLSIPDVKELYADSSLFEVGSHSMTHPPVHELPEDLMRSEIWESKRILELWFGRPVKGFAYPGGGACTPAVMRELKAAGYLYAREIGNDPNVYPPRNPYELKVSRTWNAPDFWQEFSRVRKEGGVFYFWGHSFEFREEKDWKEFEDKLARLSADPAVRWVTNVELFDKEK
jgi:type 1 glutamine amidotransferase